jgi:hypothetical protein
MDDLPGIAGTERVLKDGRISQRAIGLCQDLIGNDPLFGMIE